MKPSNKSCIACGHAATDIHHIKTRGSGGGDEEWNLLNLCRTDHVLWHQKGGFYFCEKYPHVKEHLLKTGWEFLNKKLFHKK